MRIVLFRALVAVSKMNGPVTRFFTRFPRQSRTFRGRKSGADAGFPLKSVKLTEFSGMSDSLWIRRVLVRSQEGHLQASQPVRLARFVLFLGRSPRLVPEHFPGAGTVAAHAAWMRGIARTANRNTVRLGEHIGPPHRGAQRVRCEPVNYLLEGNPVSQVRDRSP